MQVALRRLSLLAVIAVPIIGAGCSLIRPRDPAMASYEASRQQINGGDSQVQQAQYSESVPADEGYKLSDFSPDKIGNTVKRMTGNGPQPEMAKQLFANAKQSYTSAVEARTQNPNGDHRAAFLAAAEALDEAADRWPKSALQQDALYLKGESYFFADHYWKAEESYEELLKAFPHSRYIDAIQPRRFAIAQYWLGVHRENPQAFYEFNVTDDSRPLRSAFGHAMRVFDRIRLDDPTGKLADDATLALGNAYFAEGKYLKADEYYTDLRKTFPSSEHQFQAHFLGLKAKLQAYQGPDYSANAINEAEKLVKQIRKQFPVEAQREREFLDREAARIRYLKAERDWLMAQRFDRRAEYGAARHYYLALVGEYRETPFGERAERRLRAIGGLPDIPDQPLQWLVAMFPEEEEVKPIFNGNITDTLRR